MGSIFGSPAPAPTQSTTTKAEMSEEQKKLYALAMPGVQQFAATVPERYQGTKVAGFDPSQTAGQDAVLGATGTQAGLAQGGADAANFWTSPNVWDPANNAALQGAVNAAVRPITENYQETVMPRIQGEAMAAGQQFGGSRRGVAEGIASREYGRQVGDTASKLVNENYKTNVDAQMKAMGLIPEMQTAVMTPGITESGVGDIRQQMSQNLLNEDVSNFNYDQTAPFLQSKEILSLMTGLPGGTTTATSTASAPTAPSTTQQAIGLGMQLLPFLTAMA